MITAKQSELVAIMDDFHHRAASNKAVRKILRRWSRIIEIRTQTHDFRCYLDATGGALGAPSSTTHRDPEIVIEASSETLCAVFSGRRNPARAHLDGELAAFGSERDRLVLDSIVLMIWGF